MKKIQLFRSKIIFNKYIFLFVMMASFSITNSFAASLTFASGGVGYQQPGLTMTDNSGTISGMTGANYYFTVTRNSGDFTATYFQVGYDGTYRNPNTSFFMSTAVTGLTFYCMMPISATCGQSEDVTINFYRFSDNYLMCSFPHYLIKEPLQTLVGSDQICLGSTKVYTISDPSGFSSSCSKTWTTSNVDWKFTINNSTTYTGTATSLTVQAPNGYHRYHSTTITVSNVSGGTCLCHSITKYVTEHDLNAPGTPVIQSISYGPYCLGIDPTCEISAVTGADHYNWSSNPSTGIELSPYNGGLSCEVSFTSTGNYTVYVSATSMCDITGSQDSHPFTAIWDQSCHGRIRGNIDQKNISIYPNPTSENITIDIPSDNEANYDVKMYDMLGKQIYEQAYSLIVGDNSLNIDVSKIPDGIYYIMVGSAADVQKEKLIIAH
jgi:hypothetical protein